MTVENESGTLGQKWEVGNVEASIIQTLRVDEGT